MNGQWITDLSPWIDKGVDWAVRVAGVCVVLVVVWIFAGFCKRRILRITDARGVDATIAHFAASMVRYGLLAGAVLGCLGVFGIETASFAAVIAAMGLALGLALQGTLSNFAAGSMLLIFRPFKVGDVVSVAGHVGEVTEVALFSTELTTPDRRRLIIPNSKIYGDTIENITHHPTRRVEVTVGLAYDADLKKSRMLLQQAAQALPQVHSEPAASAFLSELGDSAVVWKVRVWCNTSDYWGVQETLAEAIKAAMDTAGVSIPFPQLDVHVNTPGSQNSIP